MKKVILARTAGFCFGVERAVNLALSITEKPCCTLGPLIHNARVLNQLDARGVSVCDGVDAVPDGHTVIIRSHGVGRDVYEALERKHARVVDATCPYVRRIHEIVRECAENGELVLIFGDPGHPEVHGTLGWCTEGFVVRDEHELKALFAQNSDWATRQAVFVSQTTARRDQWGRCENILKKLCTNAKILDTICVATNDRQREAAELSDRTDIVIVVGDRGSANTRALADACRNAVIVQSAEELDCGSLSGYQHVGVTAGASTPKETIEEVVKKMTEEMKTPINEVPDERNEQQPGVSSEEQNAGESFAELLEQSLKTLNTGDKVVGIITAITPTEIQVDLGTKQAAYIPFDELTDDRSVKAEDLVKVGDEIEAYVLRVNDVEGIAKLSKLRLDTVKSWEDVDAARDTQAVLEGIVIEENKGGVVVSVRGVRVFVPSSQTGLPKDAPLSSMIRKKVKLRITEFNRPRRRVVGSIRSVLQESRRQEAEQIWTSIEVGKHYDGVVKSMTSYGAFVDIGGVDGMVHVSELSWNRVKQPSDVIKIGQNIDVYVLSFDAEKKKISLGHRKLEDNPWNKFLDVFKKGDVVKVKVVKLMPFGAFAEVMPGVDGLIHISQITDHRIGKPGDAINEGDLVDVMITDIDLERKKISLSARALMEQGRDDAPVADGPDEIVAISSESETVIAADLAEGGSEEAEAPATETPIEEPSAVKVDEESAE